MAPIYMDLQMWEAASLPGMTILSVAILLVLTITLLALCTRCQRQSFNLDSRSEVERNSSTLVRVVKPGNAAEIPAPERSKHHNHRAVHSCLFLYQGSNHQLTKHLFTLISPDLTLLPEDLQLGPNEQFKAWRSHTLGTLS
ncbi:uncharacterized protein si:ch73-204p21.2 [Tachysurus ichikawai]